MNRAELVAEIVRKSDVEKKDVEKVFDLMVLTVKSTLKKAGSVTFGNFGRFGIVERKGRWGTHPKTQEPVFYPHRVIPKFTPYKKLKDELR